MPAIHALVLGTGNRKKALELIDLLAPLGLELTTLADQRQAVEVDETGDSFAANANLKASQQACALGQWVLAEDSGLIVDALGGAPGIYSARYAGEKATDEQNNQRLLQELGDRPLETRTAHYVSHLSLSEPDGKIVLEAEGRCFGRIRFGPVGSGGFGYDPLFEIVEYHRTCAELGERVKSVLSHRARALERFIPALAELQTAVRI